MIKKKQGRGRPKGEKTVVKRIPKRIAPLVDDMVNQYKKAKESA